MKLLYLVESGESKFLVFDEMPDKISTKYGDDTIRPLENHIFNLGKNR